MINPFKEYFRDKKLWGIPLTMAFLFLVFLDYIGPQKYFGGRLFFWIVLLSLGAIVAFASRLYYKGKQEKISLQERLGFEKEREEEVRRILEENPQFKTLCYRCLFFSEENRNCEKEIELNMKPKHIKFDFTDQFSYCLYWRALPAAAE